MKNYFLKENSKHQDDSNIFDFLKKKYDEADYIFEKRFDNLKNNKEQKIDDLKNLILEINTRVSDEDLNGYNNFLEITKMTSLVFGNAYLRLAQCQNEILAKSRKNYAKALDYLEEHINHFHLDEIDLLLMLNKGKYYRNTAEVGKKSDYDKSLSIFKNVIENVDKLNISNEKKFHLLLDAKINIGRVSRYSYGFDDAQKIFLSLILSLESYTSENIIEQLHNCTNLNSLLEGETTDEDVQKYIQKVKKEEVSSYIGEYLLQSLIHIGIIYRKKKEYENAKKIFELIKCIDCIDENGEGNIDAQNNLGVCYRKLGYLEGRNTPKGKSYYKQAEKIFKDLKDKGNKFAFINLYKCKLSYTESECKKVIDELLESEELNNSSHLQLILGEFYIKIQEYQNAAKWFKNVYKENHHISRGSLGLKACYKLAQCRICMNEFRQARNILSNIDATLKKNHNYIDILTEIDYAWCLMQEENYRKAKNIYETLLDRFTKELNKKHFLMINNNLADCHIHLGEFKDAEKYIENVLNIEPNNSTALYFSGVISLNLLLTGKTSDYERPFDIFNKIIWQKTDGIKITSGWIISAILRYKHNKDNSFKQKIINKIQYTSNSISMKSYYIYF